MVIDDLLYYDCCKYSIIIHKCSTAVHLMDNSDLPCVGLRAANERTFLHWMNMSVTIGSISAALLGAQHATSVVLKILWHNPTSCACFSLTGVEALTSHTCAGVSAHAHKNWGQQYEGHAIFVRSVSLVLMVLSIFMAIYAAYNFHRRGEMLQCVAPPRLLAVL